MPRQQLAQQTSHRRTIHPRPSRQAVLQPVKPDYADRFDVEKQHVNVSKSKAGSSVYAQLPSQAQQALQPHLAALQHLGCQTTLLQPVLMDHSQHGGYMQSVPSDSGVLDHTQGQHPAMPHQVRAASTKPRKLPAVRGGPTRKQAIDMLGLGLNDNLIGKEIGLIMLRPNSSLW